MSTYKLTQEETKQVIEKLEDLGLSSCFSRMTWPLKAKLNEMQDSDFKLLVEGKVFNPKHNPNQKVARLQRILEGWTNGPASITARIEEMIKKITIGKTTGKAAIERGKENAPAREEHRADWTTTRTAALTKQYKLEAADRVQLTALVAVECKINEMTANLSQLSNANTLERMQTLVELQTSLMKSLGMSRQERKKNKEDNQEKDSWESMLRSFDDNKIQKYEEAEELYTSDKEKLALIELRAKKDLEEMGFYGD